jgi:hypothetical protein
MPTVRFSAVAVAALSLVGFFTSSVHAEPDPAKVPEFKKHAVQWRTDKELAGQPVYKFVVFGDDFTDDDLKLFADYPDVRSLSLKGQKITGAGLKHLSGLKKLTSLSVAFTGITDDGMKELVKLKTLKSVDLLNCTITDKGVKELLALPDLESLNLGQNFKITDDGFKQVAALKKLRRLGMSNSYVGDKTMEAISGMPELRAVTVSGDVTDAGYAHLAKLPKLEQLRTSYGLTDKGLKALGESKSLREIDLFLAQKTTLDGLTGMANAKQLTKIYLGFGKNTEEKIKKLKPQLPDCKFGPLTIDF